MSVCPSPCVGVLMEYDNGYLKYFGAGGKAVCVSMSRGRQWLKFFGSNCSLLRCVLALRALK